MVKKTSFCNIFINEHSSIIDHGSGGEIIV
jgi:hypothetical protein